MLRILAENSFVILVYRVWLCVETFKRVRPDDGRELVIVWINTLNFFF